MGGPARCSTSRRPSRSPRRPSAKRSLRGLFVTGTDTGVGKTVVAAAICAALARRGERVAAWKPVVTGLDEAPEPGWPRDHELLARACGGIDPEHVAPHTFGPAVSPHLAAELAGVELDPGALVSRARRSGEGSDALIAEGVGGLLVPLTGTFSIRDLAVELGLPVVIAARPGLGTINHTLLTVEAAQTGGLEVRGIVLTPWPDAPGNIERSNRATIAAATGVPVADVHPLADADPSLLAAAGERLPLDGWLA